jgi:hypothetical protein
MQWHRIFPQMQSCFCATPIFKTPCTESIHLKVNACLWDHNWRFISRHIALTWIFVALFIEKSLVKVFYATSVFITIEGIHLKLHTHVFGFIIDSIQAHTSDMDFDWFIVL